MNASFFFAMQIGHPGGAAPLLAKEGPGEVVLPGRFRVKS
jgi:hypothetical protein